MAGSYIIRTPPSTTIHVIGLTNSTGPAEQIVVTPDGGDPAVTWTGTDAHDNLVAGEYLIPAGDGVTQVQIDLSYDPHDGGGFRPADAAASELTFSATSGVAFVYGADNTGSADARINAIAFLFWEKS